MEILNGEKLMLAVLCAELFGVCFTELSYNLQDHSSGFNYTPAV